MAKKKAEKPFDWKEFEKAVAAFVQSLDPTADVTYNAKLPDKDTGDKRQRDVIVKSNHLGHFPTVIVISCKHEGRKLDIQDVTDFVGEIDSCNANVGVLYSYKGFTKPAIRKATARNISCCKLYRNQPADMPELLIVGRHFVCQPRVELGVTNAEEWGIVTWNDLFRTKATVDEIETDLIYVMADQFEKRCEEKKANRSDWVPDDWRDSITLTHPDRPTLDVHVGGRWVVFEAQLKAILVEGSYSITNKHFIGSQTGPVIDMHSADPGPGWDRWPQRPERPTSNYMCVTRGGTDRQRFEALLVAELGDRPIVPVDAAK